VEGRLARSADAVITINESIAAELSRRYGVAPAVVMNSAELGTGKGGHPLRSAFGLDQRPVVLFHGALQDDRGLDKLVEAIPYLRGNPAVVFLGDGPLQDRYRQLSRTAMYAEKLYVHDAVDRGVLADWVADADVGVIPFQPVDRNHLLATPNRLFEYLSTGVPSVVSDFPEMRRIIAETDGGLTCDPVIPKSIAEAVNLLLDEPEGRREERRVKARAAAHDRYSWHAQKKKLLEVYRVLSGPSAGRASRDTATTTP
jgi:glycosyltransferase involved in cell wall biosynthesis